MYILGNDTLISLIVFIDIDNKKCRHVLSELNTIPLMRAKLGAVLCRPTVD